MLALTYTGRCLCVGLSLCKEHNSIFAKTLPFASGLFNLMAAKSVAMILSRVGQRGIFWISRGGSQGPVFAHLYCQNRKILPSHGGQPTSCRRPCWWRLTGITARNRWKFTIWTFNIQKFCPSLVTDLCCDVTHSLLLQRHPLLIAATSHTHQCCGVTHWWLSRRHQVIIAAAFSTCHGCGVTKTHAGDVSKIKWTISVYFDCCTIINSLKNSNTQG